VIQLFLDNDGENGGDGGGGCVNTQQFDVHLYLHIKLLLCGLCCR